jgi:hypothetical protein
LEFSKLLAEVVMPGWKLQQLPRKTVISGAYVPALHHLLEKYHVPTRRNRLSNARCFEMCQGYVEAACLGCPDGFWWQFLLKLDEMFGAGPKIDDPSVLFSDVIFDCKFAFASERGTYGVVACDEVKVATTWLKGAAESANKFVTTHKLSRAVLVGRAIDGTPPVYLPGCNVTVIVDGDPHRAAERVIAALTVAMAK